MTPTRNSQPVSWHGSKAQLEIATANFGKVARMIRTPFSDEECRRAIRNVRYLLRNCVRHDARLYAIVLQQFLTFIDTDWPAGVFHTDVAARSFFRRRPELGPSVLGMYSKRTRGWRRTAAKLLPHEYKHDPEDTVQRVRRAAQQEQAWRTEAADFVRCVGFFASASRYTRTMVLCDRVALEHPSATPIEVLRTAVRLSRLPSANPTPKRTRWWDVLGLVPSRFRTPFKSHSTPATSHASRERWSWHLVERFF